MKNLVLAPAVAALAMFFWGFIYYGLSGIPYRTLQPSTGVAAALAALPSDGTYLVPDMRDGAEAMEAGMKSGPVAMVHLRKVPQSPGVTMGLGFLQEFISCFLLALLLVKCAPAFRGFGDRLQFALIVGVLITFFSHAGEAIWWQQAWGWHLATMFYDVVAWLIAGAVLAKFLTPKVAA